MGRRKRGVVRRVKRTYKTRARKTSTTRYWQKRLLSRAGEKLHADRKEKDFKTAVRFDGNARRLKSIFRKKFAPEFRDYIEKSIKKKKGNRFIVSVLTRYNFKGKRVKSGFSTARTKLTTKRGIEKFIEKYEKRFIAKMTTYLKRKDANSITFRGIGFEVVKRGKVSAKTARRKRK